MKVVLRGKILDLLAFIFHIRKRNHIFKKARAVPPSAGTMNTLAQTLHPIQQKMTIASVIPETADTNTYRLNMTDTGKTPAFFRAGQYVSFSFSIGKSTVYRPFSISSTPAQAKIDGIYDITVKRTDQGFVSEYVFNSWNEGDELTCTGPAGNFYYQELRDKETLVCIAGGSGISPFKSIIPDVLDNYQDIPILLFHGAVTSDQFVFRKYFTNLVKQFNSRFFYIPVCSDTIEDWQGESGFISTALIEKKLQEAVSGKTMNDCSFFICGPPLMEEYLDSQFTELNIPGKNIRKEQFAVNKISIDQKVCEYSLIVNTNTSQVTIKAKSDETVLVALERAGLNPPSLCRSGECGWCRSRLLSGKVKKSAAAEGIRSADKKFGFIHPCCEIPVSDLELYVPGNPIIKEKVQ